MTIYFYMLHSLMKYKILYNINTRLIITVYPYQCLRHKTISIRISCIHTNSLVRSVITLYSNSALDLETMGLLLTLSRDKVPSNKDTLSSSISPVNWLTCSICIQKSHLSEALFRYVLIS